jgi:hypothetical protein
MALASFRVDFGRGSIRNYSIGEGNTALTHTREHDVRFQPGFLGIKKPAAPESTAGY